MAIEKRHFCNVDWIDRRAIMAKKQDDLNLGKGVKPDTQGKGAEKQGMNKILIIIIAVLLLLIIGGGAAYFLMGGDDATAVAGQGSDVEAAPAAEVAEELEPIYLPLDPAFVVNFEHNGSIRYLQLSLQVMSYDQGVVDKIEANMPAVRNSLILLFSGQDYAALNTLEGKEGLRLKVKEAIHKVVRLKGDKKVDDVFFTGFVMQ